MRRRTSKWRSGRCSRAVKVIRLAADVGNGASRTEAHRPTVEAGRCERARGRSAAEAEILTGGGQHSRRDVRANVPSCRGIWTLAGGEQCRGATGCNRQSDCESLEHKGHSLEEDSVPHAYTSVLSQTQVPEM